MPNFEQPSLDQNNEQQQPLQDWQDKIANHLEIIMEKHSDNSEVIAIVKKRIKFIVDNLMPEGSTVMEDLDACVNIPDEKEFAEAVIKCLMPLGETKIAEPEKFEELQRQAFVESGGFNKINDFISYGVDGNIMHIHIAPNEHTSNARKLGLLREGLAELAKIVEKDKNIKTITGTSWIVAAHPGILEKMGFTIDGQITPEEMEKFFTGEERPVHRAHIDRQELLDKYL